MTHPLIINIPTPARTYPIYIGADLLSPCSWLPKKRWSQIVVVTDDMVAPIYAHALMQALSAMEHPPQILSYVIPAGEGSKTYDTKSAIDDYLERQQCDRQSLILALGGGVVGDLAGFVAATFLRGVDYIQIPTSLLAMVDSSVGGKTGINTPYGKNRIGSIYQPQAVMIDLSVLQTLPTNQIINGLIEVVKVFLTCDDQKWTQLFQSLHLQTIRTPDFLEPLITDAIRIKADIVMRDETEQHQRKVLNFGHTIGHALERVSNYTLLHGYAVGYGILVESMIAFLLGYLPYEDIKKIYLSMAALSIMPRHLEAWDPEAIIAASKYDKKTSNNQVHYVLLSKIGEVYQNSSGQWTYPVSDEVVRQAIRESFTSAFLTSGV